VVRVDKMTHTQTAVGDIMAGHTISDTEIDARMARMGYPEWRRWRESDTYMTQKSCEKPDETTDSRKP
jgi:hypothetical protein